MLISTQLTQQPDRVLLAIDYAHYVALTTRENKRRKAFNRQSDHWIQLYNANKTSENLIRLSLQLPSQFVLVQQAFQRISPLLNQYCVSQHWFKTQLAEQQKAMTHWYGWSRKARLARKKYLLLQHPTVEIKRAIEKADGAFFQAYLEHSQSVPLTLDARECHQNYQPILTKEEYIAQKLGLSPTGK